MTRLNFCRKNGKPAAVTSWGLGMWGGKLRLEGGGGGELESWGGQFPPPPQHPPNDAPGAFVAEGMFVPYLNISICSGWKEAQWSLYHNLHAELASNGVKRKEQRLAQ